MKYKKRKPIIIEAVQWTGNNYEEVCEFVGFKPDKLDINKSSYLIIPIKDDGTRIVQITDFIIKESSNLYYPCDKKYFEETYEPEPVIEEC